MSLREIKEPVSIYADWRCQDCYGRCTFLHDLKCIICNNTDVVYCPNCDKHFETLLPEGDNIIYQTSWGNPIDEFFS